MISGAKATFLARLAQPDHSGPVWPGSVSGLWVSAGKQCWRLEEQEDGGGGGGEGGWTSWGIRLRSLVNSVCNLRECDR